MDEINLHLANTGTCRYMQGAKPSTSIATGSYRGKLASPLLSSSTTSSIAVPAISLG